MSSSSEGVVHSSGFNLAVILSSDKRDEGTYCIVATKDKMTGVNLIARFSSVYIMSSCLLRYSISCKLNTLICMLDSGHRVE